jgi:hypothetical protein
MEAHFCPIRFSGYTAVFQHLISSPPTESQCAAIATELLETSLVICSDGAHDAS